MKANEFRLGSFFCYKGCIYAANVIRDNFVYGKNVNGFASGEFPINKINPIPLTEEWLLKFGFEKDDTGVDMFDQDYYEWYQKEFPVIGVLCQSSDKEYIFDENTDTLRLKFVHELQNLYFALTGEELILNEKL
jgi:hypothetical protein